LGHDSALLSQTPALRRANDDDAPRADAASSIHFAPATYAPESPGRNEKFFTFAAYRFDFDQWLVKMGSCGNFHPT
jgi:hypothetical protein